MEDVEHTGGHTQFWGECNSDVNWLLLNIRQIQFQVRSPTKDKDD